MDEQASSGVISFQQAVERIPGPNGERAVTVLKHGALDIALSMQAPPNRQTPHEQDEIYVVVRGSGVLVHGGARDSFQAGDILFVAAGIEHHYEDFKEGELALWRVFYGARGGEAAL